MIISFGFNGAGGGGGTSDYSQLSNKPQINGVTLNGNQSSSDLGITSEALEPVTSIPSGASVGDVYAIYNSREDYYGWDNLTGSTVVFHRGLNPDDGQDWAVNLGVIDLGDGYTRDLSLAFNNRETLNDQYGIVFIGGIGNYDYGKIHTESLDNDVTLTLDLRDMQNFILSFEKNDEPYEVTITDPIRTNSDYTDIVNKTVQVETTYGRLGHFNYGGSYQGRYDLIMFWIDEDGTTRFIPNLVVGQFHYYDIMFKLYTNANGFFNIDYSIDSGSTWTNVYANMAPEEEPEYYPLDVTDPNGKNILFKAWLYPGDGNYGVKMKANKSMWIDECNDIYGIVTEELLKPGVSYNSLSDIPQINGVELKGNQSLSDLGITFNELLAKEGYLYQKEFNGLAVSSYEDINVFSVDWDGESDMTLSLALENIWEITANTPYYSGGTWYNITGLRDYPEPLYGGLYSCGYSNGKFVCEFNKDFTITGVSVGSITSAVTFYKDVNSEYRKGDVVNLRYEDAHSDNWITFVPGASRNVKVTNSTGGVLAVNYGNNLQESIEIDSSGEYVDTTGWIAEGDYYFKYTPDMGKLMILHSSGDFYWEIRGGNENLYINNPDVNGIAGNYSMKLHYSSMVGPYIYNGFFWEKLV